MEYTLYLLKSDLTTGSKSLGYLVVGGGQQVQPILPKLDKSVWEKINLH